MRRTWRWALLAVVILLVGYLAYLLVRVKFFPTRYDVAPISRLPAYQDPALLRRTWELPVASRYGRALESQRNLSVCGPTSASNALRSLGAGPATADGVVEGTGKCRFLGYCWNGLTLDELAGVVRSKTTRSVTVARDLSLAEFRAQMARANDRAGASS